MLSPHWSAVPAGLAALATVAALGLLGASPATPTEPPLGRPAALVGLYRMEAPEGARPDARRRFPTTEVTFLRLLADGRSRLENVTLEDRDGTVAPRVEVGAMARAPWGVRGPDAQPSAGEAPLRLCLEVAGRTTCQRYVRDAGTGDLTLFRGPDAGSATLRLERVR